MSQARTTCPYCGVGCGIIAERTSKGDVRIKGDPDHPSNFGRLCSKGAALAETIGLEGRLLEPHIEGSPAKWDQALDLVAARFAKAIAEHGPDSVAFYVSGQLLTEDYYVVNKLAKGFIGTANIDTNSRLCMASSVAGHKRAFGSDTVPGCYEDIELADLVVLVGSNMAWCHPVLHQRMTAARARKPNMRVVVIDPRRTDSAEGADLHLPLRSGSDAVLFNGLLAHLDASGMTDKAFVEAHTSVCEPALAAARPFDIRQTAQICGLSEGSIELFFTWFARTRRVVTLYSQGINQSSSGSDKVNAIINCHLLTGRIGLPGMGPLSLTGQPNAMGGREVGGLANQLAAHMELENPAHRDIVSRFWKAPRLADAPGLKAVDMFRAAATGRIKALWIISTNPAVTLPESAAVRAALAQCEFVVVSDVMEKTDTMQFADVALPAAAWGEKNGTVTNSERRISRQRSFLTPPGEARADWDIICDVARRMGYHGFDFTSPAEIFAEHAALSGFENNGTRDFDISGLSGLDQAGYEAFAPVQWPLPRGAEDGTARFFAEGGFFTPHGKARFNAVTPRAPANATDTGFPLVLNTGRVRDHWHTMTRTGKSQRLSGHIFEPYAEISPDDARRLGLSEGGFASLETAYGQMTARVRISPGQRKGCVFVPMHWSSQFTSTNGVNALVNAAVDPVSGQPESKHTPLRVAPYQPLWQALALSRRAMTPPDGAQWTGGLAGRAHRLELWSDVAPADWETFAADLIGPAGGAEWLSYRDASTGQYRYALIRAGRLEACLFVGAQTCLPSRSWATGLFEGELLHPDQRMSLLAGRPLQASADIGALVCSCHSVGHNQITAAIAAGASTLEALGERLRAGTNCGSCKPELARLLGAGARQHLLTSGQSQ